MGAWFSLVLRKPLPHCPSLHSCSPHIEISLHSVFQRSVLHLVLFNCCVCLANFCLEAKAPRNYTRRAGPGQDQNCRRFCHQASCTKTARRALEMESVWMQLMRNIWMNEASTNRNRWVSHRSSLEWLPQSFYSDASAFLSQRGLMPHGNVSRSCWLTLTSQSPCPLESTRHSGCSLPRSYLVPLFGTFL